MAQQPATPTWAIVARTPDALMTANLSAAMRTNGLALVEEAMYYRVPRTMKAGTVDFLRIQSLYDCNVKGKFRTVTVAGFQVGRPSQLFNEGEKESRWGLAPKGTNLEQQWEAVCQNGKGAIPLKSISTDEQVLQGFRLQQQAAARRH